MVTTATVFGIGDALSQSITKYYDRSAKFDFKHMGATWLKGCFIAAPLVHYHLTKILPYFVPVVNKKTIFTKVFIDQIVCWPFYMALILPS